MSAQQQKRFFETLLNEIATGKHGKFEKYRLDFADKQIHNFFLNRKTLRKGFSDHLKSQENKSLVGRTVVLAKMDRHITNFIHAVAEKINSLVAKDKKRYVIQIHKHTKSELHATFDAIAGKSIYSRVMYTYKEARKTLLKEYFKVLGRAKGGREDVFQLSHEEFAGAAESAVSHALDLAVQAAGGGITKEKAKQFLKDSGIDIRVVRDTKTDIMTVTLASAVENAADNIATKGRLKALRDLIRNSFSTAKGGQRVANMPGSDSFTEIKRKRAIQQLKKALDQPSLQLKFENSKIKESKTRTKIRKRQKNRVSAAPISMGGMQAATARRGISSEPLRIIGLLNQKLPDVVRKNMNPPALQNQTGRFAESVKVTEVQKTPKGFPSFGYTYQKNPYQRFEVGRGDPPWATPERDPRKLIDQSIREIAAQFAMGRFFTRRV